MALTGFDEQALLGTGAGHMYLAWLMRAFPDVTPELLEAWRAVEADYPPGQREAGLRERVLGDAKLGPFARGVTFLWYTATWNTDVVGPDWSKAYGQSPENQSRAFGPPIPRASCGRRPSPRTPAGPSPPATAPGRSARRGPSP